VELPKASALKRWALLSLWNCLVVFAVYTVYVIVWLRFTPDQLFRWLIGGIPMNLATGWFIVWAIKWFDRRLKK